MSLSDTDVNRVKRLIVLGGPSCCGKSTLLRSWEQGACPFLSSAFDYPAGADWRVCIAARAPEAIAAGKVILHYAFPSLPLHDGRMTGFSDDPRLDIVNAADEVHFVTLRVSGPVLLQRVARRKRKAILDFLKRPTVSRLRERKRLARLEAVYRSPDALASIYRRWDDYIRACSAAGSLLVDMNAEPELVAATDGLRDASGGGANP